MEDRVDAFARLKRLHTEGVLTDAEYEREKAALRAKFNPRSDTARAQGSEFVVGMRERRGLWLLVAAGVILAIGAWFFIKAASIPEGQGELGEGSTSNGQQASESEGFSDLCLLASFMNVESLGHRVSVLADTARQNGRSVAWERSDNGMILRISWSDQLAGESHEMGIELVRTANAAPLPDCAGATEGAVATRMNVDGEILSGLAVGVALQQALLQVPSASAAPDSSSVDPADANATAPEVAPSSSGNQSFTPEQERLIELNADLESECRGNPPGEEDDACVKREAAMDRLNATGVCWGTEDQPYAAFDFHICHPGSNGYDRSPQARRNNVDAM